MLLYFFSTVSYTNLCINSYYRKNKWPKKIKTKNVYLFQYKNQI